MNSKLTKDEMDFVHLELNQAIETFRAQFSLYVQIQTVFVVANVTIIGYAISNKVAGLFFLGSLIPMLMLFVSYGINRLMLPVLYSAIVLEAKFGVKGIDWLAHSFMYSRESSKFVKDLLSISQIKDENERIKRFKKQKVDLFHWKLLSILVIGALGQIGVGIILLLLLNWKLL